MAGSLGTHPWPEGTPTVMVGEGQAHANTLPPNRLKQIWSQVYSLKQCTVLRPPFSWRGNFALIQSWRDCWTRFDLIINSFTQRMAFAGLGPYAVAEEGGAARTVGAQ